jgi:hypothetical protein
VREGGRKRDREGLPCEGRLLEVSLESVSVGFNIWLPETVIELLDNHFCDLRVSTPTIFLFI